MALIKSISGIRGTIGGKSGDNLTPLDVVKFTSAFGIWIQKKANKKDVNLVIGRDARISGKVVSDIASSTLQALGINVIDLGLSTTPTVEIMVTELMADGGIIFTASHNPKEWNALKLLNNKGEFVSAKDGEEILEIAEKENFEYIDVDNFGNYKIIDNAIQIHIDKVLDLQEVSEGKVREKRYKIVVDAVNSTGGIAIPKLLERMGCDLVKLYCEPNGQFPHNPEPLKEHLSEICKTVIEEKADLGIVVDPDVDRLVFVDENGELFGEEYTLVAIADYILKEQKGVVVSNLSSSNALRDVAKALNSEYFASAVGEVNVVEMMKKKNAIIGGEGNGGVIFPKLHYGRDAIVGVALFLTYLSQIKKTVSELRATYPNYFMGKKKIDLNPNINIDLLLKNMESQYQNAEISTIDGLKISFPTYWIHLRKSNTEPIIRIYTEANSQEKADILAKEAMEKIKSLV